MARFIAGLTEEQRALTVPGTMGGIEHTFSHLVNAEAGYLTALGWKPAWVRPEGDPSPGVRELLRRTELIAAQWPVLLAGDVDLERPVPRGDWEPAAGQVIAQAIHHGNEHRGHICTILGAHGLDWPDVSGWAWAREERGET